MTRFITCLLLTIFAAAQDVDAEILVFKATWKAVAIGEGDSEVYKDKGFVIVETDTGETASVWYWGKGASKEYEVENEEIDWSTVQGAGGQSYMVMRAHETWGPDGMNFFALVCHGRIKPGGTHARTLKGLAVESRADGEAIESSLVTLKLDKKRTKAGAASTVKALLAGIVDELEAKGYDAT